MKARVPSWLVQVTWFIAGIFGTGAFWYYLSRKDDLLTSISAGGAVVFALVSIGLHIWGEAKSVDATAGRGSVAELDELRRTRRAQVATWRDAVEALDEGFMDEERLGLFLSSSEYSTLRPLLTAEVVAKLERPRTAYVGGSRGNNVRKYLLLDEVARIEREWRLV